MQKKDKLILIIYVVLIFSGITMTHFRESITTMGTPIGKKTIVIDAGHGDWDPGKVSDNGILEKDINLEISKNLQLYLEQSGGFVLNTRIDDTALAEQKREDLAERKNIANDSDVDILVSIHQNSFPDSNVSGAQVFYYDGSEQSEKLANCIQTRLKEIDNSNNRIEKSSTSYYILKETTIPAVIIECGFLSNPNEVYLLSNKEYQNKISWAIYLGILDYYS